MLQPLLIFVHPLLIFVVGALAGLVLQPAPAHAGLMSRTGPVIAILAGNLFVGEARGNLNGSGTIGLHSRTDPNIICSGQFTYGAKLGYGGNLQCNDGSTAIFQFQRLSLVKGYGSGSFTRGPMSFTYGLGASESVPYLKLPPGKFLEQDGNDVVLVDTAQDIQSGRI